jgi:hypothetical protein
MTHTNPPYYIVTRDNDVDGILDDLAARFPGSVQIAHRNVDGEIRYVCLVHDGHMPALENAQFIVKACNNHEPMYKTLDEIKGICTYVSESIAKVQK